MRRFLLAIFIAVAAASTAIATTLHDESLNYVVTYKWGLIHKDAGDATLSLRNRGNDYVMTLTASSKPWADKIYRVRDTLTAVVGRDGFHPRKYIKAAHEDGKYMLDVISYSREGRATAGNVSLTRVKKGKTTKSSKRLSVNGDAYDMLSIFYYIRMLDFSTMKPGHTMKSTVFSGSKSETVSITFKKRERVKTRATGEVEAYRVTFSFTTDGKKKSSDDMEAWISTDADHKVLRIIGRLPVGQVRVELR